jgi:O-antigen ligase
MVASMFPLWCLCLGGSIGLLRGRSYGFYCMVAALILSIVGSTYSFLPFVGRFFFALAEGRGVFLGGEWGSYYRVGGA